MQVPALGPNRLRDIAVFSVEVVMSTITTLQIVAASETKKGITTCEARGRGG